MMRTITIRIEKDLLRQIEEAMKIGGYASRSEFIREAVRDKIIALKRKKR